MAVERTTLRRARKPRRCASRHFCGSPVINPGDLYLEHVISPGHDLIGNTTWLRSAECGPCAAGRGDPAWKETSR